MLGVVAVTFSHGTVRVTAQPGRTRPLVVQSRRAPWPAGEGIEGSAATACGAEALVAGGRVYASRDGTRWAVSEGNLPDGYRAQGVACTDGTAFVWGSPGLIARRDPAGGWTIEHREPEERGVSVVSIVRESTPDGERLHARASTTHYGRVEFVRSAEGSWTEVPAEGAWLVQPDFACPGGDANSLSSRLLPTGAFRNCPDRTFVWTHPVAERRLLDPPDRELIHPPGLRTSAPSVFWTERSTYLVAPEWRGAALRELRMLGSTDRVPTHQRIYRYRDTFWQETAIRSERILGVVDIAGTEWIVGNTGIYRVLEPHRRRQPVSRQAQEGSHVE